MARKTDGSNGHHTAKRPGWNDHRRRDQRSFYRCPSRGDSDQVEVNALRAEPRGTKEAFVVAPRAIATATVLKLGKVRVGWVNATARE